MEACTLVKEKMIPVEEIRRVFTESSTIGAELDASFLCFDECYEAVKRNVPENKIILDFGCAYAPQSYYFTEYEKYIGIDNGIEDGILFDRTENSEFYFTSIQDFIENIFPTLGIKQEDCFAICSYVPDFKAGELVKQTFSDSFVYYIKQDNMKGFYHNGELVKPLKEQSQTEQSALKDEIEDEIEIEM